MEEGHCPGDLQDPPGRPAQPPERRRIFSVPRMGLPDEESDHGGERGRDLRHVDDADHSPLRHARGLE